ncbi:GrpB family protein [Oceanicaulis sp. MMSF_3324]|uniref:GrpB family protein n=1 Tax=Oceanicaulis sp. MMSF_3324 TaxID=3046702 RepID=UPI00273D989E|nr:GrpB family protein [Oceanicaulis sp. MMSF_3324]
MSRDPIHVSTPDPAWADEGLAWADAVCRALGSRALRVDHVGSTAVPGLAAKDVIDIQALVVDLDDPGLVAAMKAAGFVHRADNTGDDPHPDTAPVLGPDDWRKLYFREAAGERRIHIHVRRNGAAGARNTLLMRDFLREDESARRDYGDFKMALAEKTRSDRSAYQAIKRPFISTVLRSAESWAEIQRWAPGVPDSYWRTEE